MSEKMADGMLRAKESGDAPHPGSFVFVGRKDFRRRKPEDVCGGGQ